MNNYPSPRKRLRDIERGGGYDPLEGSVASANECTGLTATIPENEAEAESYREIYDIPLTPEIKSRKKPDTPPKKQSEQSKQ